MRFRTTGRTAGCVGQTPSSTLSGNRCNGQQTDRERDASPGLQQPINPAVVNRCSYTVSVYPHIHYIIDTTDNPFSMSQLPILTRAVEQEADITLQMPSTSTVSAAAANTCTPSSSDSLETLWSQYEAYLESAQAAQEAGVDIFPQPAFVIKVSLLPPVKPAAAAAAPPSSEPQLEGDRLFINVCTDAAVDAPELVKATPEAALPRPDASSSSPPAAGVPPGSLRLPMSVGPLSQCLSRSGVPSLCVDVIVHPDTVNLDVQQHQAQHEHAYSIALAQAAIIQRRDGVAPAVPSPAAAAAMTLQQVKRTVASLAIDKLQAKYGLRVDEQAELRFPKLRYKGTQPPPAQRIRRNRDNPLHQTSRDRERGREEAHKPLIEEVMEAVPPAARSPPAIAPHAGQSQLPVQHSAEVAMEAREETVQAAHPAATETSAAEEVTHPKYELTLRDGEGKEVRA